MVFIILVLVNFIVITKGAGRIAEVAARFTLDAMPGKQMSIDADLNAGVIDEMEAIKRRKKIQAESDFYGAMDGASKFVRGDAVAGLITLINIIGGLGIGVIQKQMTMVEALQLYTLLSIGDGLVSQIPALILSTATGILVTRATAKDNLGKEIDPPTFLFLQGPLDPFCHAGIHDVHSWLSFCPVLLTVHPDFLGCMEATQVEGLHDGLDEDG